MNQTDNIYISHTREDSSNASFIIFYSKCIIKNIIKSGIWGFDLSASKVININNSSLRYSYWDYQKDFYDVFLNQNKKGKHTWFIKLCQRIIPAGGIPS